MVHTLFLLHFDCRMHAAENAWRAVQMLHCLSPIPMYASKSPLQLREVRFPMLLKVCCTGVHAEYFTTAASRSSTVDSSVDAAAAAAAAAASTAAATGTATATAVYVGHPAPSTPSHLVSGGHQQLHAAVGQHSLLHGETLQTTEAIAAESSRHTRQYCQKPGPVGQHEQSKKLKLGRQWGGPPPPPRRAAPRDTGPIKEQYRGWDPPTPPPARLSSPQKLTQTTLPNTAVAREESSIWTVAAA